MGVGVLGIALSCLAYWLAERADRRRAMDALEFRAEWRARDIEAKVRLSANAVENMAIALAANPSLGPGEFGRIARRVRRDLAHVNSLQWAPRVPREGLAELEASARGLGFADYRVFEVTPDFQPTELEDRAEYYPVLFEERFRGDRRVQGLSLGKYDGRRLPMLRAQQEGRPVATMPVRPIGPPTPELVYLLFWPVYDTVEVPDTPKARRTGLRGFALGNYDIAALLAAAIRDTPPLIATLHVSISRAHQEDAAATAAVVYTYGGGFQPGPLAALPAAVRIARHFDVFDQHWELTFDFPAAVVANLRSRDAWGWLAVGLLLTAALIVHLLRGRARTQQVEALVAARTAELQQTSEQLHQAQKMEAIGNLTGGVAHDFNNLLTVVIGNLDLLRERLRGDPGATALADAALQAGARGAELTHHLLAFARRQPLAPQLTDVNRLVVGMTRLLERILEANIEVTLVTGADLWPAMIDPAQLSTAITNLATNARDAMPDGGQLTIETRNVHLDDDYVALNPEAAPGDYVLLQVSDTGAGMPAALMAKVFEPFFTTKQPGRGTGLGLSMVFGFVKQSRGHVKIYSEVGEGTTVRLYLPRAGADAGTAGADRNTVPPLQRGRETILVVEDNAEVRRTVVAQLTGLGYAVMAAASAAEALSLLRSHGTRIDLLFTDIVMPGGMNGHELARAALTQVPSLQVLFTSGYSGVALGAADGWREGAHFLSKPYRRQELAQKLREVFGSRDR